MFLTLGGDGWIAPRLKSLLSRCWFVVCLEDPSFSWSSKAPRYKFQSESCPALTFDSNLGWNSSVLESFVTRRNVGVSSAGISILFFLELTNTAKIFQYKTWLEMCQWRSVKNEAKLTDRKLKARRPLSVINWRPKTGLHFARRLFLDPLVEQLSCPLFDPTAVHCFGPGKYDA